MTDQYFEGILQLRNADKKVKKWVKEEINKRKDVWIAKEESKGKNTDLWISSWRYLLRIGKKLKQKYSGELKTSRRLYSMDRQTMKKTYRVTVLFRMHGLRIGQTVDYKGKKIKIKTLGKKVSGTDEKGKRTSMEYKELM